MKMERNQYKKIMMAIMTAIAVCFYYWGISSVALAVGAFAFSYWFYSKTTCEKRDGIVVVVAGILALFISFGRNPSYSLINHFGVFLGAWILFSQILLIVYKKMDGNAGTSIRQNKKSFLSSKLFFLLVAGTSFAFWFIYFLAYYPGILTNDSYVQLYQALGLSAYSNHHPWIHTLWLKAWYNIGMYIFDIPQRAVAVCTLAQMGVFSCAYSFVLTVLYTEKVNGMVLGLLFAYYVLWPVNAHNMVYIGKDNFFATFVLLFVVVLWMMVRMYRNEGKVHWKYWIAYTIIGFLMSTFRSNGWYAFLLCIPLTMYTFKKIWRCVLLATLMTVFAVLIFKGPVMKYYNVTSPDLVENLSIPLQQVARVIDVHGVEALSDEEYQLLSQIIDVESIPEIYYDRISDNIKNAIRYNGNQKCLEENILEYARLYIHLGLRNFKIYFEAFVCQTNGYYFPIMNHWVNHAQYAFGDSEIGITIKSLLSDEITEKIKGALGDYPDIPVYKWLWYIGPYVWITFIMLGYMLRRHEPIYPFLPILAIWITLLVATPVYSEFRYIQSLILTCPFLCCVSQLGKEEE